jgi:hypothetical protein
MALRTDGHQRYKEQAIAVRELDATAAILTIMIDVFSQYCNRSMLL